MATATEQPSARGPKLEPHQVILRPLITEKGTHQSTHGTTTPTRSRSTSGRPRTRSRRRSRSCSASACEKVRTQNRLGKKRRYRFRDRQAAQLEEGHRHAARGRPDRVLLIAACGLAIAIARSLQAARILRGYDMGIRQYKPTTPGRRQGSVSDFAEITDRKKKPEKSLLQPQAQEGRPQQPGHRLHALPRRRPQADVPHHRLQAQQGRRLGHGASPSSTTPTARRASPCSSTRTARRRTSWRRKG